MLERDSIDFSLIGMQEISYSLDHFVHFIFAGDTFKQFSFINKRTQDVNSGIGYLHGQGNAHRVWSPLANILASDSHCSRLGSELEEHNVLDCEPLFR